jgi:hypothetical protein
MDTDETQMVMNTRAGRPRSGGVCQNLAGFLEIDRRGAGLHTENQHFAF